MSPSAYCGMAIVERRSAGVRAQVHYLQGHTMCSGDLIFRAGLPILVVSWRVVNRERVPYVCFALEPAKLKPGARPGVYVYEGDVGR